jgi:hypothetical protein
MSNIWRLRWINLVGGVVFSIYGLLVGSYPVFFMNAFICLIDVVHLARMAREEDFFSLLPIAHGDNAVLVSFMRYYADDIKAFFPDFEDDRRASTHRVFILRNMQPVGLFIYTIKPDATARVEMDYVAPEYRDLKNAHYLFTHGAKYLYRQGIRRIIAPSFRDSHAKYLRRVGFTPLETQSDMYIKHLEAPPGEEDAV